MIRYLVFLFFLVLHSSVFAQEISIDCKFTKQPFTGYYVTMYKGNEVGDCGKHGKQERIMIDYEKNIFIVPKDSLNSTYFKKVVSGNIDYLSLESTKSQVELLNEYLCKERQMIPAQNLGCLLSTDRFYKIKSVRKKYFKINYIEGECLWISIPKKKFISLWGTYSKNLILRDTMNIVVLSTIQTYSDEIETNRKIRRKKLCK